MLVCSLLNSAYVSLSYPGARGYLKFRFKLLPCVALTCLPANESDAGQGPDSSLLPGADVLLGMTGP